MTSAPHSSRIKHSPHLPKLIWQLLALCLLLIAGSSSTLNAQGTPDLPSSLFDYSDMSVLPRHFTDPTYPLGTVATSDNTPVDNPTTDAGATLGRVLFYDTRLSANDTVSCASCHQQKHGFSDPNVLSIGFNGGTTGRHSMGLANTRYYDNGRMFWDERAGTLERQVLLPIQDPVEMGMSLGALIPKLEATSFYPDLFTDAFGDPAITPTRISRALAQFVRSMVSYESRHDLARDTPSYPVPDFNSYYTPQERLGLALFQPIPNSGVQSVGCDRCHQTAVQGMGAAPNANGPGSPPGPFAVNNGLDATTTDAGAGNGRFKSPSLRNIEVTAPYMHDGRFSTLEDVVEFYNSGVQPHPNLDPRLRAGGPNGPPRRLNLSPAEKAALVAFLKTLTDDAFLTKEKFATPFPQFVPVDSFFAEEGTVRGGSLESLQESEDNKLRVQALANPRTSIVVETTSPTDLPHSLKFTLEASTRAPGSTLQSIEFFNYQTNDYELIDERNASTLGDGVATVEATGDLTRFVEPGTQRMKARLTIRRSVITRGLWGFYDQAVWIVR